MSEFEATTENTALKQAIIDRIEAEGPISFRDYMAIALYHPGLGYYTGGREVLGRGGDFVTSPEASPVFGGMLGRQLREMWEALGSPATFDVVEAGAGSGALARDILAWANRTAHPFFGAIQYIIVEASEPLAEKQRARLAAEGLADKARWLDAVPRSTGIILSNELLDAMPVNRVTVEGGELREVFVTWDGANFGEELRDPAPAVVDYFKRVGLLPGEGSHAEVNPSAVDWVRNAAASLERGFFLTIDYGYEADELYAPWRKDGTLLCFYRQNPSTDPYARIGRQDMTSHIDFTSVRRAAEEAGLTTLGMVTQSQFLMNLGIGEAMQPPGEGDTNMEEYFARRRAVTELIDPAGLGRIRVLVQARGVGEVSLTGLRDA